MQFSHVIGKQTRAFRLRVKLRFKRGNLTQKALETGFLTLVFNPCCLCENSVFYPFSERSLTRASLRYPQRVINPFWTGSGLKARMLKKQRNCDGVRTWDPRNSNPTLYQLSHRPVWVVKLIYIRLRNFKIANILRVCNLGNFGYLKKDF